MPYVESVVRTFYCNITYTSDRKLIQTIVKGELIVIDRAKIFEWLGMEVLEFHELHSYKDEEAYKILMEMDVYPGPLQIRPADLPSKHRIVHYLYSRGLVNKGGSYSYLSNEDKQLLCNIIKKDSVDLGSLVIQEMLKAVDSGERNVQLAFPTLVSLILKKNRIWFLEDGKSKHYPEVFTMKPIHRMGINFRNAQYGTSRPIKRKKGEPVHQEADEAQSARIDPATKATLFQNLTEAIRNRPRHEYLRDVPKGPESMSFYAMLSQQIKDSQNLVLQGLSKLDEKVDRQFGGFSQRMSKLEEHVTEIQIDLKGLKHFTYAYASDLPCASHDASKSQFHEDGQGSDPIGSPQHLHTPVSAMDPTPSDSATPGTMVLFSPPSSDHHTPSTSVLPSPLPSDYQIPSPAPLSFVPSSDLLSVLKAQSFKSLLGSDLHPPSVPAFPSSPSTPLFPVILPLSDAAKKGEKEKKSKDEKSVSVIEKGKKSGKRIKTVAKKKKKT